MSPGSGLLEPSGQPLAEQIGRIRNALVELTAAYEQSAAEKHALLLAVRELAQLMLLHPRELMGALDGEDRQAAPAGVDHGQ